MTRWVISGQGKFTWTVAGGIELWEHSLSWAAPGYGSWVPGWRGQNSIDDYGSSHNYIDNAPYMQASVKIPSVKNLNCYLLCPATQIPNLHNDEVSYSDGHVALLEALREELRSIKRIRRFSKPYAWLAPRTAPTQCASATTKELRKDFWLRFSMTERKRAKALGGAAPTWDKGEWSHVMGYIQS